MGDSSSGESPIFFSPDTLRALFITGPTAVGKTEIALQAASFCNGEIIGADAFQIYQGLDVLTAKPSRTDRQKIPHHLIDFVPSSREFDVSQYLDAALRCVNEITARGKLPIIAGGTGLYVRALTHGLSDLPRADAAIRADLDAMPLEDLRLRYTALDPQGAAAIDLKNKRRLVRALEVSLLTGKPFSSFRDRWDTTPDSVHGLFLIRERDDLYARINRRVEEMFRNGVVREVGATSDIGPTAAQAIGFKEIHSMIEGQISERECIEYVQQATRRYAKRQITWFRSETVFETVDLSLQHDPQFILQLIEKKARAASASKEV